MLSRLRAGIVLAISFLAANFIQPVLADKASDGAQRARPNIVLIVADDLGYANLGCYGQQKIRTPHLDAMAKQGMKFTRFYAGSALCLPSRVCLMTGLHTGHSRVRVNGGGGKHPPIHEEDVTLATVMKAAGYRTGMTGKWALGDDFLGCVTEHQNKDGSGAIYKHGWDFYFGEPNQTYNHRYYPKQLYRYDPAGLAGPATPRNRLVPVTYAANQGKSGTHYSHDEITTHALKFIEESKEGPFFLYVPYTIPHADFVVPELEDYTKDQPWDPLAKTFASMISRMDRDCGRIIAKLKELEIDRHTLVIFTSDHGGLPKCDDVFDNNGDLEGFKGDLTEGGLRVPCIAWWPGTIQAGSTSDQLLAFWDYMPTLAELAGIAPPKPIDGISFVPTLKGKKQERAHRYLYFELGNKRYVVRGEGETRSDAEIGAEASTKVVVPKFEKP